MHSELADDIAWLQERYGSTEFTVDDLDDDDPILVGTDGTVVDTWRENYPYSERLSRETYEHEKRLLQIELLKLQKTIKASGARHVLLFEGRDAAGKGGTIKRFMEHLNPRGMPMWWRWRSRPIYEAAPVVLPALRRAASGPG